MVIEGTLALTGQWTITDYWEKTGRMQGFLEGFKNVARDEHRHVAYGTWYLKKACRQNPALADRIRARLSEHLPVASLVLVPPGQDPNDWELLGYTSEQVNKFAFTALTRRLKVIGISLTAPEPGRGVTVTSSSRSPAQRGSGAGSCRCASGSRGVERLPADRTEPGQSGRHRSWIGSARLSASWAQQAEASSSPSM